MQGWIKDYVRDKLNKQKRSKGLGSPQGFLPNVIDQHVHVEAGVSAGPAAGGFDVTEAGLTL